MWALAKLEVIAMVPITRLRKTKRTVGVNQLFMEDQIEGINDTDCSNMAVAAVTGVKKRREEEKWRFTEGNKGNVLGRDILAWQFVWEGSFGLVICLGGISGFVF